MPAEGDDEEIKYGDWNVYDAETVLAEERRKESNSAVETADIWPNWSEGVPKRLRRTGWGPSFFIGTVHHRSRLDTDTLELNWNRAYPLTFLEKNKHLLPGDYTNQWSGIYRIFSPDTTISRCCSEDPTGTLYLGRAGSRGRNWSILRTRIQSILNQRHHAITNRWLSSAMKKKYPWASLAVEWAFTGKRLNYKGEPVPEAIMAERWLLSCYRDSYGELPPLNEKG